MIKISVIIPNYNNSNYILECLNSILNQTMKNFEVIIVDDGSTDDSVEKINNYLKKNDVDNVKLICQYNQNASIARNRGLELAIGEYIYFIDSDDSIYDNNVFEKICNEASSYDLLIGNYIAIDKIGNKLFKYDNNIDILDISNKFKYCNVSPVPSNKLYRLDIIKNNNIFFDNVAIGQDLNFFLKYLSVCNNIKMTDDIFYKYRILNSGMSKKNDNFNFFEIVKDFKFVKKFYEKNNMESYYYMYLPIVELDHYSNQMNKLINFNSIKEKKIIFNYFSFFIRQIDYSKFYNKKLYKKVLRKYKLKSIFRLIYFSKYYKKIRG